MNLSRALTLTVLLLATPLAFAQAALQSAPLIGSGYICLVDNASAKPIELQLIDIRDLSGQTMPANSSTCEKKRGNSGYMTLQPGEGCFVTWYPSLVSTPVYCRVEHNGAANGIAGTLLMYIGSGFASANTTASTILQPAELQK